MAAIMTSILSLLRPTQTVVYTIPIYGGTQHFVEDHLSVWGITGIPVLAGHSDLLATAISPPRISAPCCWKRPRTPR